MSRDILFLLPPGFEDRGERQYCPECAEIYGVLAYYPSIRESLTIVYEGLDHPRAQLVDRLGEGRWNCPTLILDPSSPDGSGVKTSNGTRYLDSATTIARHWSKLYGTALPR